VPLLCKEFVVDEAQLDAARAYGADLVLLIVRCLTPERLGVLVAETRARQMVPFVEVHTAEESRHALDVGADLIGVNARDLDTLQMDVEGAARILSALPPSVTRARLSGLATTADVRRVAGTTVDAALVGEALMRQDDPEPLLKEWVAAAGGPAPIRQ
jgi:indole-3-glycerol phosphate synthase